MIEKNHFTNNCNNFRSVCIKVVKFFASYIFLGVGFLIVFKIMFTTNRSFHGVFGAPITMLAMMTGEIDTASKLFHEATKLRLVKNYKSDENNEQYAEYVGNEQIQRDYLQFAGKTQYYAKSFFLQYHSKRYCSLLLCRLCHLVHHRHHEPPDRSGCQ